MKAALAMENLQIDPARPELTPEQTLTGWRREFCVELFGEGEARIFLRAVEVPSMKADALRQAILFHRVGTTFVDFDGCVAAVREPLEQLARTAARQKPDRDNPFAAVTYDRSAWDRVVLGIEHWQRRPRVSSHRTTAAG